MATNYDSAGAVQASLVERPVRHLVDGRLIDGAQHQEVINPATGQAASRAPVAGADILDQAVTAARRAQSGWGKVPIADRKKALFAMAAILRTNAAELAGLITLEQGKPLAAARFEVERAAALQEALASIDVHDEQLRDASQGRVEIQYRPVGVVGAITPWNQPVGLAVPCVTHALYMGNTLVLKPSPYAPLAVLRLGELVRDVFPVGVLNIINGAENLGRDITAHPDVDKISFTGSVATGRKVMASAAGTLKRVTLELGGNDAAIVMADARPGEILDKLFGAAFVNAGQVCMSIKRLYVPDALYDEITEGLADRARKVRLGSGFDPATTMGPVQNLAQFEAVRVLIDDSRAHGRIAAGGGVRGGGGYFIEPTIVADIGHGTALVDEEAFGPILPILHYSDIEEVVGRANDSPYGLAGSVWSPDIDKARSIAERLSTGTVWINHHVGADPFVPFGGMRNSGFGCQFGLDGLREYATRTAVISPVVAI